MKAQRLAVVLAVVCDLAAGALGANAPPAKQTGSISGRAVDKNGPVAGAIVRAIVPRPAGKPGSGPLTVAIAITRADGTFILQEVPAGRARVIANLKGEGFGYVRKPVVVVAGQETRVGDIELQPPPKGGGGGGKGAKENP